VDVEGSSVLSDGWDQPRCARGDRQFIAKGEMAVGCSGVSMGFIQFYLGPGEGYRDSLLENAQEAVTIACTRVHR